MTTIEKTFPAGWLPESQYHPEDHLSKARKSSEKNDYLNIAQRMVWFVQEQRQLIAAGLATCPFILKADLIELDLDKGRAVFKATARDVLGNESVEYGSESKADFNDFVEKAATKAKGRALASLGYGTQFSPELDEGERIADAPKEQSQSQKATPKPAQAQPKQPAEQGAQPSAAAQETTQQACARRAKALDMQEDTYKKAVKIATGKKSDFTEGDWKQVARLISSIERIAPFGYRGNAWLTIFTQAADKDEATLLQGLKPDDWKAIEQRVHLLEQSTKKPTPISPNVQVGEPA